MNKNEQTDIHNRLPPITQTIRTERKRTRLLPTIP